MTSPSDSSSSVPIAENLREPLPKWLKVSAFAVGSALAGGLAAAWFFQKTLTTLREAEINPADPDLGIPAAHVDEDT
jgi:hypothetical protein